MSPMAGAAGFSPALTIDLYAPIWHAMNDSNIHEQFWRLRATCIAFALRVSSHGVLTDLTLIACFGGESEI